MIVEELAWRDPIEVFAPLAQRPHAHLLHAGGKAHEPGWSVIVCDPVKRFHVSGHAAFIDGKRVDGDPFGLLRGMLASRRQGAQRRGEGIKAPFLSGAIGYVGYEVGALLESTASGPVSPFPLPDMTFGFYNDALLFDREKSRAYLVSIGGNIARSKQADLLREIYNAPPVLRRPLPSAKNRSPNFSEEEFKNAVTMVIRSILEGDIFQANIAQHLSAQLESHNLLGLFHTLSQASDAEFGAVLQYEGAAIISNSPERFFQLQENDGVFNVRTQPIKGTRPRGETLEKDEALKLSLISDAKERAENIMIVDLIRNDLSRVCEDASILEEEICSVVSLSSVHHLVSTISGQLKSDCDVIDVIKALFPCGSITGAPKIEAMKTIASIEPTGRGPYCGALGYIDDSGAADFSVAIRTMIAAPNADGLDLVFPVGGGITLLSDPFSEYKETLIKARSIRKAIGLDAETE